jgi:hypothetical protein
MEPRPCGERPNQQINIDLFVRLFPLIFSAGCTCGRQAPVAIIAWGRALKWIGALGVDRGIQPERLGLRRRPSVAPENANPLALSDDNHLAPHNMALSYRQLGFQIADPHRHRPTGSRLPDNFPADVPMALLSSVATGACAGAIETRRRRTIPAIISSEAARGLACRRGQRRWPRPTPIDFAFCRTAPSVRFIAFATCGTGVFAFECALSSRKSSLDQGLR